MPISIRIKRGVGGAPTTLLRGELAFDEDNEKLYIGKGDSGSDDANGLPIATSVVELTTPPSVLADLADISVGSGASDGDVLVYDSATAEWVAEAVSIAWDDVTSKPASFTPSTHASSHHTGGGDAIAPADIGAAAATHSHAWGDITSGVPSTFTPSAHKASHATGGSDALSPADIGAIPSSEKGANSGVATLDAGGKLETTQLPNLAITAFLGNAANEAAMLALTGQQGDWAIRDDTGAVWIITGSTPSSIGSWTQLSYPAAPVASVNGATGTVVLDHTDVGAAATSHTHAASDITSGLATVATTGAYSDLSGTPTLGTAAASATSDFVAASAASTFGLSLLDDADAAAARTTLGLGSAATSATGDFAAASHSHAWGDITSGVPSTFTPASHTHGNISNDGKIGTTADALVKTGSDGTLTTLGLGFTDQYLKTGTSGPEWAALPATSTPSAHNHGVTVTLELSGFIEAPEGKTYVLSPAIPAAITITNFKARTGAGSCDIKLQDDGTDITNATLDDVDSDALAEPVSEIVASVASGSRLTLVVSDATSSAPEDLAFTVYYTTTVTSANNA